MKWLHNLLKGMSLTTALFVFQSCYGMPQGARTDMYEATFKVVDTGGRAVEGVRISAKNAWTSDWVPQGESDAEGMAQVYVAFDPHDAFVDLRFEAEGFIVKDTTITDMAGGDRGKVVMIPSR